MSVTPLNLAGSLTVDEAAVVLRAATAAIDAGCREVHLHDLETVDSSAVAMLLAIRRHALAKGVDLRFSPAPPALTSLIALYEVGGLLGLTAQ